MRLCLSGKKIRRAQGPGHHGREGLPGQRIRMRVRRRPPDERRGQAAGGGVQEEQEDRVLPVLLRLEEH